MKRFFPRLWCRVFGHKYELIRIVTCDIREVKCARCQAEFGVNDETRSRYPLTDDLKEWHNTFLPQALKAFQRSQAEVNAAVTTYNRLLKEAKSLQNRLELSLNRKQKQAFDRRIREKVAELNEITGKYPDVFQSHKL